MAGSTNATYSPTRSVRTQNRHTACGRAPRDDSADGRTLRCGPPVHACPLRNVLTGGHRRNIATQDRTEAELLTENYALRGMLVSLRAIEQAKGTIMRTHGVTAGCAFGLLRGCSQHHNISVRDLAARLMRALSGQSPIPTSRGSMGRLLSDLASHPSGPQRIGRPCRGRGQGWTP